MACGVSVVGLVAGLVCAGGFVRAVCVAYSSGTGKGVAGVHRHDGVVPRTMRKAVPTAGAARRRSTMVAKVADEAYQRYEEAWFNFHRYDTDDSGTIDAGELAGLLVDLKMHVGRSHRTDEQMRQWVQRELQRSDTNKDGVLSFDEFLAYYNNFVSRHRSQWDELYAISEQTLGAGAFGVVLKGRRAADGQMVAVKKLSKDGIAGDIELLHNEIAIWEDLDHPHLVKLLDVFEDQQSIILITELMHGGDLFKRLRRQPEGRYGETAGARLARQIVSAVAYLHSRGVVHCDLKPSNVLVAEPPGDESGTVTVKVADFGLSQTVAKSAAQAGSHSADGAGAGVRCSDATGSSAGEPGGGTGTGEGDLRCAPARRLTAIVGTPNYFAPELVKLAQRDFSATHYDAAVDNWAVGCLVFELLAGTPPFEAREEDVLFYKIVDNSPDFPASLSADALSLIRALMCSDPAGRLTAAGALQHPWLAQAEGEAAIAE